jgi:dihydroflavonol-4-reductase
MDKGLLLVTGATGLVGSTLCLAARKAGYRVRALARSLADTEPLRKAEVELVSGDVTDRDSLVRAAKGVQDIVHCAAVIGGTWSKATPQDFWSVNYEGVVNVLEAAKANGVRRSVCYSSKAILDWSRTATNSSPIAAIGPNDTPYLGAKRAAFYFSMHRACIGQDVITVVPGGIYGPAPLVERAIVPTSYTGTLLMALKGGLDEYVPMPHSWSFVDDVVAVGLAALERGSNGARYLAVGLPEDECSLPDICNRANAIAGVPHRVRDIDLEAGGEKIGVMKFYAQRKFAKPLVDPSETEAALGVRPTPLDVGLRKTVGWFREHGKI